MVVVGSQRARGVGEATEAVLNFQLFSEFDILPLFLQESGEAGVFVLKYFWSKMWIQ